MDYNIRRHEKLARILHIVVSFMFWATIVFGGLFAILGLFAITPGFGEGIYSLIKDASELSVGINNFTTRFDPGTITQGDIFTSIRVLYAVVIIYIGISLYILFNLKELLRHIKKDSPFSEITVKYLRNIGVGIIVLSFTAAINSISYIYLMNNLDFIRDGSNPFLTHLDIQFRLVDIPTLVGGLIVLLTSQIFAYGTYLQTEVDQTV